MQEKVSIIVVQYRQKFPSFGSRFGITRQSLVMPNHDPRDGNFCPTITAMKDTYSLFLLASVNVHFHAYDHPSI